MGAIRLIIAALIAVALAALPVTAGFAQQAAAKAEARPSSAGDDCSCCEADQDRAAAPCTLKCCAATMILIDRSSPVAPRTAVHADTAVAGLVAFAQPPDPPPPRS